MKSRSWAILFAGLIAALLLLWKLLPGSGGNTIEVSKDGVRVISAGCPDQVCVAHGFLVSGKEPIICLPNRLVIRFQEDARTDGADVVAGGRSLP